MNAAGIVQATAAGAAEAAALVYQTDPGVWDYLFSGDRNVYDLFAAGLWALQGNNFSFSESVVIDDGTSGLAGLEMGYSGAVERKLRRAMVEAAVTLVPGEAQEALLERAEDIDYLAPFIPEDAYYLHFLSVHPRARGRGLGRRLLDNAFARARALACTSVHLDVYTDNPAVGLYRAFGFRVVVETRFPHKQGLPPHYRMVRAL